jgi:LPXTG-site transpeptidase (sortase) family protein
MAGPAVTLAEAAPAVSEEIEVGVDGSTERASGEPAVVARVDGRRSPARAALLVVALLALAGSFDLVVVSRLQHGAAQTKAFSRLRQQLAVGTAPVGALDSDGHLLALGAPVAVLEIPSLHLKQVVLEGTTSSVLMAGPGHLRSTILPGQAGTSVLFGRASAYGGPFGGVGGLRKGAELRVTTGAGTSTFTVAGVRREGDPQPAPLAAGKARLTLVTASGHAFLPDGVLRVDADLDGEAQPAAPVAVGTVSAVERPMAGDTGDLWMLVLLLEALLVVTAGAVWSWMRWGRQQTWIVFFPLVLLVGHYVADRVIRFLPNLL